MDQTKLKQAMRASISDVLETMFFTPVEFLCTTDGACEPFDNKPVITVRLAFSGPVGGYFRLVVPKALAAAISADFLGVDRAALSMEDVTGTVKEMANMLAGNTFSLYDNQVVFDLRVPEVTASHADLHPPAGKYRMCNVAIDTAESQMMLELAVAA